MAITFYNQDNTYRYQHKRGMSKMGKRILEDHQLKAGHISVIFCNDDYLYEMNKEYLKHDYYTDIITFDYSEGIVRNGDLFISIDRTLENARKRKVSHWNETTRIIIHGILHLAGYYDKKKQQKMVMTEKEDYYLGMLTSQILESGKELKSSNT